jgi:hypothetical protein
LVCVPCDARLGVRPGWPKAEPAADAGPAALRAVPRSALRQAKKPDGGKASGTKVGTEPEASHTTYVSAVSGVSARLADLGFGSAVVVGVSPRLPRPDEYR